MNILCIYSVIVTIFFNFANNLEDKILLIHKE
jgi:hypothetical protein